MKTERITENIKQAAAFIRNGALVAVPTETVYGLAGNGLDASAVSRIYEVKGRPAVKPLSLMVPGEEAMDLYCRDVPKQARACGSADCRWRRLPPIPPASPAPRPPNRCWDTLTGKSKP